MDSNITVLSMNCQGLGDLEKRKDVFHFLKQKKYAIYLLQDTHFTVKEENFVRSMWGFECFFDSFSSQSRGVAILLNNTFEYKLHKIKKGNDGNKLLLDITIQNKRLTLVNIYGPNRDKPNFYNVLKTDINDLGNETVIIGADYNLIMNEEKDCKNYLRVNNPRAREALLDLCAEINLIDIWREFNLDKLQYTWKKLHPFKQARLDFFLVSEQLFVDINSAEIEAGYRTDHSAINIILNFQKQTKGRSFWKFNNSLLKDPDYVKLVKNVIKAVKEQYSSQENTNEIPISDLQFNINEQLFFDTLLMEIRGKTISYSTYKKKKSQNKKEASLINEINILEENFDPSKEDTLKEKQKELLEIRQKKIEGVKIRSRARWIEEGEKASKYFCNMENRNYISKMMPKLIKDDGSLVSEQEDIINETKTFYENLYSYKDVDDVDLETILNFDDISKLDENQKHDLEGKITDQEALKALKHMPNNKSPGSDGFTTEFFKFFWIDIGQLLVQAINYGYENGELSSTQREGIITCIPKGDKPKQFLKNWRPISLLNVSYKIASACIANRLKKVLPDIINIDQTGFLTGRYIGENIRTLYDLMAHTEKNNIPALLLLIDFEKAFDSVAWPFIHKVLNFFNFGDSIKKWMSVFYNNIKSCVIVNGHTSSWFKLERGCRQGDPLSPYIFILCVEILAHLIRKNPDIKGVRVNGEEYLISQYADDTSLTLDATEKSLRTALNLITYYAKFSGLSMNNDKTRVIWLGSMKNSPRRLCQNFNLNWDQGYFTVLGIKFSTNLQEITDINYNTKFREIKNLLLQWSKRNLTPYGKNIVIKTLAMSKINHLLLALPTPPTQFLKSLQSLFFKSFWSGAKDRIKRTVSIKNYDQGGLRMLDINAFNAALKLTWIRRLQNAEKTKWVNLLESQWSDYNKFTTFGDGFVKQNLRKLNTFWQDVFQAWNQLMTAAGKKSTDDYLNEPIWLNKDIQINKKCTFIKKMYDSGTYIINDLIDESGAFLSFNEYCITFSVNVNFIEYNGLLLAIRKFRQSKYPFIPALDKKLQAPTIHRTIKLLLKDRKGCRSIYSQLIENNEIPTSIRKWENEYGHIQKSHWLKIFNLPYKISIGTSLRWFQLRIIHRTLATNTFLQKIDIIDNNTCSFCKTEPETLSHLFCSCQVITRFWITFFQWLQVKCVHIQHLHPTNKEILLGIIDKNKADLTLNFILLTAKQYIYKCRGSSQLPHITSFQKWLRSAYDSEKFIAFKNCNWNKFNKRWAQYQNLFNNM